MGVRIHKPPEVSKIPGLAPLVFLAGPIQGAVDWQHEATIQLEEEWMEPTTLHIANPRRVNSTRADFDTEEKYRRQTRWERPHLFRAMRLGANVFWLACKDDSIEYPAERAYAQTTRFEFAMAYTKATEDKHVNISLGIEPGYTGSEKYYRDLADELNIPVYNELEATVGDALEKMEGSSHHGQF